MNILSKGTFPNFGQRDDISNTPSPQKQQIQSQIEKKAPSPQKDYYVGGVQMNILDIKHINEADAIPDKPQTKKKFKG